MPFASSCRAVARSRVTFFIGRCRSTRTLSLKDRRDGLRIQRTHRRASTPKVRRKKARPQLRYRPLMPSWRMGRSTSRPLQPIRKDLVIRFRRQRLAREAIMAAKEISVKKYVVRLSGEERERLETLLRKGKSPARRVLKARILLKADVSEAGKGWSDNRIIEALETSPSMVYRVRKQLVEEGFEAVLSRK